MTVSLSQGIFAAVEELYGSADEVCKQVKAAQIEEMYKSAVQSVFGNAAYLVLKHTNAVYCFTEKEITQFIVYANDSSIRSSLDARQELLKIALYKQGLQFSQFKVLPAKKSIKDRHPFEKMTQSAKTPVFRNVSEQELQQVDNLVASVEDLSVREALKQAVISCLKTSPASE